MSRVAPVMEHTLASAQSFIGVGLHTGKSTRITIKPAPAGSGVRFVRTDVDPKRNTIAARWHNITNTLLCTVLGNEYGVTVSTVEHLLAALHGCGIDNALIELDGPEVPILDGSAALFVELIRGAGVTAQDERRRVIWIQRPIEIFDGDKFALLLPAPTPRITVSIDFPGTAIGHQTLSVALFNATFARDIAKARTFGFAEQIAALRERGLARGGSLDNAVLVDGMRIVNTDGLRYEDEFVRHKILDCLGDLALAGAPIIGHLYTYKPGHELNQALVHKLNADTDAWRYLTWDDYLIQRNTMPEPAEPLSWQTKTPAVSVRAQPRRR